MVSTRFVLVITVWPYQCLPNFLMDTLCFTAPQWQLAWWTPVDTGLSSPTVYFCAIIALHMPWSIWIALSWRVVGGVWMHRHRKWRVEKAPISVMVYLAIWVDSWKDYLEFEDTTACSNGPWRVLPSVVMLVADIQSIPRRTSAVRS